MRDSKRKLSGFYNQILNKVNISTSLHIHKSQPISTIVDRNDYFLTILVFHANGIRSGLLIILWFTPPFMDAKFPFKMLSRSPECRAPPLENRMIRWGLTKCNTFCSKWREMSNTFSSILVGQRRGEWNCL